MLRARLPLHLTTALKSEPNSISPATRIVASPRHASCELEGEAVILALDTGTYYGLDGVGRLVWESVQTPLSIEAVCDVVMKQYDVDASRCQNDVIKLAAHLMEAGLLELA